MQILTSLKKVFEAGCKTCVPLCDIENENDDQAQVDKKEQSNCLKNINNNTHNTTNNNQNQMKDVKCKHCNYKWTYNGSKNVNVTCPDCRRGTPL